VLQIVSHFVRSPLNALGVNFGNFTLLSLACDRVLRGGGVTVRVSLVVLVLSGGVCLPMTVELGLEVRHHKSFAAIFHERRRPVQSRLQLHHLPPVLGSLHKVFVTLLASRSRKAFIEVTCQ